MAGKKLISQTENHPVLYFLYLTPYLFIRSFFLATKSQKIDIIHTQGLNAGAVGVVLKAIFQKRLLINSHAFYSQIAINKLANYADLSSKVLKLS